MVLIQDFEPVFTTFVTALGVKASAMKWNSMTARLASHDTRIDARFVAGSRSCAEGYYPGSPDFFPSYIKTSISKL